MGNKPTITPRIKKPGREEISEVARLIHSSWQSDYKDIIAPDFLMSMSVSERHEKLLIRFDEGISEFLVMREAGKLIGAAVFGKSFTEGYPDDGEISAIYLQQDFIGKGYGHVLFAEIEKALSSMGFTHFVLDVLSDNKRAAKFYINHGYENVRESHIRLGKADYSLYIFRKENIQVGEVNENSCHKRHRAKRLHLSDEGAASGGSRP